MTKKKKRKEEEEEEWLGRDYIGGSGVETEIREYGWGLGSKRADNGIVTISV